MQDTWIEWHPLDDVRLARYLAGEWTPQHVRETEHGVEVGSEWTRGHITVDEGETVIEADYRADVRWNGWLCPRLSHHQTELVLRAVAEYPDLYMVCMDGPDFIIWDYNAEGQYHPVTGEPYALEIHSPDERGHYFPGYMAWCWETWEIERGES